MNAVDQLAQTRQAIAQYWAQKTHQEPATETGTTHTTAPAIPNVLAGLALMAVAEKLLRQTTPLRKQELNYPVLETTRTLVHATAQTHPGWLIITAALVGAGLAAARPWRWLKCSELLPHLLPHLLTQLTTQALKR